MSRNSVIKRKPTLSSGFKGPDSVYVVELWDGDSLIETRELPDKSIYYAESLARNWDAGIGEFKIDK